MTTRKSYRGRGSKGGAGNTSLTKRAGLFSVVKSAFGAKPKRRTPKRRGI